MHTEADARELWCPFARLSYKTGTFNRFQSKLRRIFGLKKAEPIDAIADNCLASSCAAWRWGERYQDTRDGSDAVPGKGYEPGVLEEQGYCGLAGRP